MKKYIAVFMFFVVLSTSTIWSFAREDISAAGEELLKYRVILPDENGSIREDDYLTVIEALDVIEFHSSADDPDEIKLRHEHCDIADYLEPLPLDQQKILFRLRYGVIILENEWKTLDVNAYCTEKQAILYCVRNITDTAGCVIDDSLFEYTTEEAYETAFDKGIISSASTANAEKKIKRRDFFEMFYKSLYVEYSVGGVSTHTERKIDILEQRNKPAPTAAPTLEEKMEDFEKNSMPAVQSEENRAFTQGSAMERWMDYGIFEDIPFQIKSDRGMTRAEFVSSLCKIMGYTEKGRNDYEDVESGKWFYDSFLKATYAGVIKGSNGYACPEEQITREEAAVILARTFAAGENDLIQEFEIADAVSPWAEISVKNMVFKGYMYIDGKNRFNPHDSLTYLEFTQILDQIVRIYYDLPRTYGSQEMKVVKGNVIVASPDVVVQNLTIEGSLYLAPIIRQGKLILKNVHVNGTLQLSSSGDARFCLIDCSARNVVTVPSGNFKIPKLLQTDKQLMTLDTGKEPVIHDDMSISWTLPENMLGVCGREIKTIGEDGLTKLHLSGFSNTNSIDTKEVIQYIADSYPIKLNYICYAPYASLYENEAEFMKVDVSCINATVAGNPFVLDSIQEDKQNHKICLTAAAGSEFKKGQYYCLTQYRHYDPYCMEVYPEVTVFQAEYDAKTYCVAGGITSSEEIERKDIKLQEVSYQGNAADGFEVVFTPMTDKPLKVFQDKSSN